MTRPVWFRKIDLAYGCHTDPFELPEGAGPVVIAGPNGAGKSTLVEAFVRTLFGFSRRQDDEKLRLQARRPWTGGECRARVEFTAADGSTWSVARDFDSDIVDLVPLSGSGSPWRGDGNPAATNVEAIEYRKRLAALFGLPERVAYEQTACVHQGQLMETGLGRHLLRIAAGGHADVEAAQRRLVETHRRYTKQPIAPGASAARNARELEELEATEARLREELRQARLAEETRGPLVQERDRLRGRLDALRREIEQLESAQGRLSGRRAVEAERRRLETRIEELERVRSELTEAVRRRDDAAAAWSVFASAPLYPDDFEARIAVLETMWDQQEKLIGHVDEARRAVEQAEDAARAAEAEQAGSSSLSLAIRGLVVAAVATLLVGAVANFAAGRTVAGAIAFGLAAAGSAGLAWYRSRVQNRQRERRAAADQAAAMVEMRRSALANVERQLDEIRAEIRRRIAGIPNADTLNLATLPDRRDRFERQRAARERLDRETERLAAAVRRARAAVGGTEGVAAQRTGDSGGTGGPDDAVAADATAVVEAVDQALREARNELARHTLELESHAAETLDLPHGTAVDPAAVAAALASRREERERVTEEIRRVEQQLAEHARTPASSLAIQQEIEAVAERAAEVRSVVRAHELAYALLGDAYEAFRARDQERLIVRVSDHLTRLSRSELGPVETDGELESATVRVFGRPVPLSSPPLSFGELHAALFAVRLGAADFLAANGVRPPLLVDEPFAHLDVDRAAGVWSVLQAIAEERQVIVATQDELVLERLGIEPHIRLRRRGA